MPGCGPFLCYLDKITIREKLILVVAVAALPWISCSRAGHTVISSYNTSLFGCNVLNEINFNEIFLYVHVYAWFTFFFLNGSPTGKNVLFLIPWRHCYLKKLQSWDICRITYISFMMFDLVLTDRQAPLMQVFLVPKLETGVIRPARNKQC